MGNAMQWHTLNGQYKYA